MALFPQWVGPHRLPHLEHISTCHCWKVIYPSTSRSVVLAPEYADLPFPYRGTVFLSHCLRDPSLQDDRPARRHVGSHTVCAGRCVFMLICCVLLMITRNLIRRYRIV